jgi:hypothetical protein
MRYTRIRSRIYLARGYIKTLEMLTFPQHNLCSPISLHIYLPSFSATLSKNQLLETNNVVQPPFAPPSCGPGYGRCFLAGRFEKLPRRVLGRASIFF